MFYNFTNRNFTARWDGKLYTFKPFQIAESSKVIISDDGAHSVLLTSAVARVFAHHLAVDVLNHPLLDNNFEVNDKGEQIPQDVKQLATYNNSSIDAMVQIATNGPSVGVEVPKSLEQFLEKSGLTDGAEEQAPEAVISEPQTAEPSVAPKRRHRQKKVASPSENVEFAV